MKKNIHNAGWFYNSADNDGMHFYFEKCLTLADIAIIGSKLDYCVPTLINLFLMQEDKVTGHEWQLATNGIFIESPCGETLSYTALTKYKGRGRYYAPPEHPFGEKVILWGYDE